MADTFDKLGIRIGRVIEIAPEPTTHKPTYKMVVDFGKFGPRQMGEVVSEVLILGVQYPKKESGEATPLSPMVDAKIGGKLF